jgi:glycosyltransferase involved in cell wall biosynthesis
MFDHDRKDVKNYADVSVIIPCFNSSDSLLRACESILSQSLLPAELILIDDASNDNGSTRASISSILDKISRNTDILCKSVFLDDNVGPGMARNAGWEIASCYFLSFLDADDTWHPEKIEFQYSIMKANSHFDLTCHYSVKHEDYHKILNLNIDLRPLFFLKMLFKNFIETRSVMLKRSIPFRFEKHTRFSEDYKLWLDMIGNGIIAYLIPAQLASTYRNNYSPGGQSSHLIKMEKSELKIYWALYEKSKINLSLFIACVTSSIFKFLLRQIRSLGF